MPEQASSSESTKSVTPPPIDNTNSKKFVLLPAAPSHSPLKITRMMIGDTLTQFKMAPEYFVPDDQESVSKDIIYQDGNVDEQSYITVARYRTMMGEPTDFKNKPLQLGANSVETLILALDKFSQHFDGELNFSKNDIPFQYSSQRAVCGMADFGSILILLADIIPTAKFEFQMKNFDYDELAQSRDAMEKFALDFCAAICGILQCEPDYIRLFSIEKSKDELKMLNLTFGLTTPVLDETEKLAKNLQIQAQSGFTDNDILKDVKQCEYECKWKTIIEYFNIQKPDLDPRYNFDYRKPGVSKQESRGNEPYYLPIGWYRHGLKVDNKYAGDIAWLGRVNAEGEWPVAFHGTNKNAVLGITQEGLLASKSARDIMKDEAIKQMGEEADRPGIYLATHCNDGADRYADSFTFPIRTEESATFQVVFQCRVQPRKFTRHTGVVTTGEAWRFVDESAIRPYGILLKEIV
ncbi:unnamed protein product [Rotaria sp. Silwood1]|nr:unnamed protein product [Rotaria sp. Silwood1]CAF4889624.1 unnamed protein product [Rotaria sp. Silwood1]